MVSCELGEECQMVKFLPLTLTNTDGNKKGSGLIKGSFLFRRLMQYRMISQMAPLHKRNEGERGSHSLILKSIFLDHQTSTREERQDKARSVVSN